MFDTLVQFKSIGENLLSTKIISVQTDEGKEFVNRRFQNLFSSSSITHQLACPYTPEQMGSIECKHYHMVETGLALFPTGSVP